MPWRVNTFCPQMLTFAPNVEQFNHWRREKPLEMRIVLNRFCTFASEFSRFCPFSVGEGLRLSWIDRSFSSKNWMKKRRREAFAHNSSNFCSRIYICRMCKPTSRAISLNSNSWAAHSSGQKSTFEGKECSTFEGIYQLFMWNTFNARNCDYWTSHSTFS